MTPARPKLQLVTQARQPPPEQSNYELDWSIMMARAQLGDRDAYRRLLSAIVPYVRARALVRLYSPEEAEDTVQDILLTIHEARQSYDPARPFGPWLAAIADRRIADRLRRIGRRRKLQEAVLASDSASEPARWQDQSVLDGRALDAAIADLTPEQAQAIRLLKLEELSLGEASAQTAQTAGALKAATHRALKALRDRLFDGGSK
jgi:RNA polymerase sigma-70 factor (ECF subfamily)